MNKISISIILIISLIGLGCVSAAYGQSYGQSSAYTQPAAATGYAAASGTAPQYSEYYTMPTGPKPAAHIIAPQKYAIESRTPATVYFGNQMQAVLYSQYLSNPIYKQSNSLWIQGSTSWSQYAAVPQGAVLSIIAISSTGGNGYLYEIYPDGKSISNNYYFFPGANLIGFYADTVGQHTLLISVNGQVSSQVIIDVAGSQPTAYQQPAYQQPVYYPTYTAPIYPIYKVPVFHFPDNHWPHDDHDNSSPNGHHGNRSPGGH
jgi:hypothetical protein